MKNIIKNSLVLVVLFSTFLASANSSLRIYNDDSNTRLTIDNVKQGNTIFVKDTFGTILYSETIKSSGDYTKSFDFSELPNGEYFFEIDKGIEIKTMHFSVKDAVVALEEEKSVFKPFVKSDKNIVSLSKLSLNEEPVEVNIYFEDNSSELIYSETIKNTQSISRTYSLNKLEKGNYKIVTKAEGRTFVDYVQL